MTGTEYACPDCTADTELNQIDPGIWVLTVRHDDTCPELARRTRQATQRRAGQ